jgi:hypothetical protein
MSNAFYYSKEHIPLKNNPELVGIDIDWYLSQYQRLYKHLSLLKRPQFSKFISSILNHEMIKLNNEYGSQYKCK